MLTPRNLLSKQRIIVLTLILLAGCTPVVNVPWKDIAGNSCQTTKVKADWYTAETATSCLRDKKVVDLTPSHTDVGMAAGIAAGLGAVIGAIIALL